MSGTAKKELKGLKAIIISRYVRTEEERYRLAKFLLAKEAELVVLIGHPISTQVMKKASLCTVWERGRESRKATFPRLPYFGLLYWIGNIIVSLYFITRLKRRYDVYFGTNWPDTILGILLKKLGLIKEVVLWTTEFFPRRFRNPFLNKVYHYLDRFCIAQADYVWSSTQAMVKERQKQGYQLNSKDKQIIVPYFIDAHSIQKLPTHSLKPYSIIYAGCLRAYFDFKLLLDALIAIKKEVPSVKLTITSWEFFPQEWRREIKAKGLEDNFEILGYIESEEEFIEVLQRHQLGLAIYMESSFTDYSDPAKLKDYMARGVVPIVSRTIPIADEIEREKAGIAVKYHSDEIASAVVKLLSDQKLFEEYRENAFRLASKYETNAVLGNAFQEMGYIC